jgi:hypothetical protein
MESERGQDTDDVWVVTTETRTATAWRRVEISLRKRVWVFSGCYGVWIGRRLDKLLGSHSVVPFHYRFEHVLGGPHGTYLDLDSIWHGHFLLQGNLENCDKN